MGRGRQKAKQTKVARELKYFSPETDYDALRRELAGSESPPTPSVRPDAETDDDDQDEYADWSAEGRR
jgi:Protein of unknown function (DUF3073)